MKAPTRRRTPHNRVAAIVAHPDDEILGCGGTLRRHVLGGDEVSIIILADGESSRDTEADFADSVARRGTAAHKAAGIIGAKHLVLHRLPDNRLDGELLLDVVKVVEKHIDEIRPHIVYTHHAG